MKRLGEPQPGFDGGGGDWPSPGWAPRKGSTIAALHPGAAILLPLLFSAVFILQWNNPAQTLPPSTVRVFLVGFPFPQNPWK